MLITCYNRWRRRVENEREEMRGGGDVSLVFISVINMRTISSLYREYMLGDQGKKLGFPRVYPHI